MTSVELAAVRSIGVALALGAALNDALLTDELAGWSPEDVASVRADEASAGTSVGQLS